MLGVRGQGLLVVLGNAEDGLDDPVVHGVPAHGLHKLQDALASLKGQKWRLRIKKKLNATYSEILLMCHTLFRLARYSSFYRNSPTKHVREQSPKIINIRVRIMYFYCPYENHHPAWKVDTRITNTCNG